MKTNIMISAGGTHVVLDADDVRAMIRHHTHHAVNERDGEWRAFHRQQVEELQRSLQDALDRTEIAE